MKRREDSPIGFTLDFLLFCAVLAFFSSLFILLAVRFFENEGEASQDTAIKLEVMENKGTVVIDAGHGGEDGGAVGRGDVYEKDLNLDIACRLRDCLIASGYKVVMTRSEDILLYDRNSDYKGHKKSQDLKKRLEIAQSLPDSVFISIHMNAFPDESCRGLQVWYSKNSGESAALAEKIQRKVREELQGENERKIKAADSSIYLLDRASSPAVLIECGFLSNPEELALLSLPEYRASIASLICDALCEHFRQRQVYFKE